MPLQNRVTPSGEIVSTPQRGLFTGNRGIIHDPATRTLLNRRWSSKAWITCTCEFRGRRRDVMGTRSWTELFFLDEATAFAAGHRPCFYCRRDDANAFRAAWERGNGVSGVRAPEIDEVLHRERLNGQAKRLHALPMPLDAIARWRDGAGGGGQLSDRAGQGVVVVVGWISRSRRCIARRPTAHAAFDVAGVCRGISACAASERDAQRRKINSNVIPGAALLRGVSEG